MGLIGIRGYGSFTKAWIYRQRRSNLIESKHPNRPVPEKNIATNGSILNLDGSSVIGIFKNGAS